MKSLSKIFHLGSKSSTYLVFFSDLLLQFILIGKYLDNSIISSYAPSAVDAADYASRALIWQSDGFSKAFGDCYRMPGYPAIILLINFLLPSAPYLGIRLLQMLSVAISVSMLKVVLEKYVPLRIAVFASLIYAVIPIWHFSPILLAESFSSFIVVALILVLSSIGISKISRKNIFLLSVLIALAFYLKPNNLMLLIIVIVFIFFVVKTGRLANLMGVFILVFLFISPWLFFVHISQPGFIGLTTNSGTNLYIGTGMFNGYDESLLSISAIKWRVDLKNNPQDIIDLDMDEPPLIQNEILTSKSIEIWKKRPIRQLGYGLDKVLFAFGLKTDNLVNKTFGFFTLGSFFSGLLLLRKSEVRVWGITLLSVTLLLALQAAIFQADRRFIIPVFFPFAIICLGIALGSITFGRTSKYRLTKSF